MYTVASWMILLLSGLWEEAEYVPSPHQTKINMESQFPLHGGILKCHQSPLSECNDKSIRVNLL